MMFQACGQPDYEPYEYWFYLVPQYMIALHGSAFTYSEMASPTHPV